MLNLTACRGVRHCDGITRRELLRIGGLTLGGLALPDLLQLQAAATGKSKAKSAIVLFLSGGPSQLDMWDLKPDAPEEIRGTFQPIDTTVPGMRISEHLPRLAQQAKRFSLLRAVNHATGSHPAAAYWMMTGSPITRATPQSVGMSREDRPNPGSVVAKLLPQKPGMPSFVMVPEAISPVGSERPGQHAGFLGSAFDPSRVNSDANLPDYNPGALTPSADVSAERLNARRQLMNRVGLQARYLERTEAGQNLSPYYSRAFDLISSKQAQQAFDISGEPVRSRERYGRHVFGQSVLLARRLVEAGVRLVQVNWVRHDNGKGGQGYDSHRDHLAWCKTELLPPTDAAVASLLEDLADRGMLEETLVIVTGEFGRTPKFNANGGRDHWHQCFSVMLAGGGLTPGLVHGVSDASAAYPVDEPVTPQEIIATLYHQLGIDPETLIYDLQERPHFLVEGKPIADLV
jgi:uncharacterized protein (DUF1501 family)